MIPEIKCPFCWKAIPVTDLPQGAHEGWGFKMPCGCKIKWEAYKRIDFKQLLKVR